MSYQTEPKAIYPDHQAQAPYGQPVQSPPPNYQQQQYPQPDQQQYQQSPPPQQYQQSPPPQQYQQSPPPQQFQQYPSYQEHQHSTPPQAISPTPVQPTPHPQMEQKGATNHAAGKPGDWQHGMCGCFGDCGKCCMTFWCPCITYGKIQHRLRHNDMSNYSNCNGHCWGFCGLMCCGFQWVMGMMQRGEIRQRYNLDGSGCGDCCRHFWCECCVLIQEDRETESRKALLVPANQTGYQQTEGMAYHA